MEKKLHYHFSVIVQLVVMLLLSVSMQAAQKRDLHGLFQQGAAKGMQLMAADTEVEVDLSEWESDYDTPIVVATGLTYHFRNGVVRKKNDGTWKGGPLFEISNGSRVYLESGASFDGGGFKTDDEVVLIKDGAFMAWGGSITGVYGWSNPTENSNGDTAVRLMDVDNPKCSPLLFCYDGTSIVGRVDNNTVTGKVELYNCSVTSLSTACDVYMGSVQIVTNLYFYNQNAKVCLSGWLQYNLRLSNYAKDQLVVAGGDHKLTESDVSKIILEGDNASQYKLSLEDNDSNIYVREQGPVRSISDLEPGTLPDRITDPDNIEELTITGQLNGTDIKFIRQMANTNLKKLDISGCSIVSGGDYYLYYMKEYAPSVEKESVKKYVGYDVALVTYVTSNDEIGTYMFAGLSKLENLILPNSVTTVRDGAFMDSPNLSFITFGSSVEKFESGYMFCGSDNIAEIKFNNNSNFVSGKISIFDSYKRTLIAVAPSYSGVYPIPNTVDSIAPYAFVGCMNLKSVGIPSSLTHISDYAFFHSGVQSITIPSTVTSIGDGAFYYCENLTSVTFSENIESIGAGAFAHCKLTEADLSMTKVTGLTGDQHASARPYSYSVGVFAGTNTLTTVKLPATLQSLGGKVFSSSQLKDIYSNAITPPTLWYSYKPTTNNGKDVSMIIIYDLYVASNTFHDVDTLTCRLHIPRGTLASYRAVKGWNAFLNIEQDLPNDNFDPNYITDAEWLQQRLDEIAAEAPKDPVTLNIQDEGIVLNKQLSFKAGCNVILTGGKLTIDNTDVYAFMKAVFYIYQGATVKFQDITIDFNQEPNTKENFYFYDNFYNAGHLTIGENVAYENSDCIKTSFGFYFNIGTLFIYSGDVYMNGTVINGSGNTYLYGGTVTNYGNAPVCRSGYFTIFNASVIGEGDVIVDAAKLEMMARSKIQGGDNSTLISERTDCKIGSGTLVGGKTYGNGSLGLEEFDIFPRFELKSGRIDVTTKTGVCAFGVLPEIYLYKDAYVEGVDFPSYSPKIYSVTINGDWKNMANGHVLVKNLGKEYFKYINFVGIPYSDGRWRVEYDEANRQAVLHKMTLQEWFEEQNKGDKDTGTEEEPVVINFPDYDDENGDLWEGTDMVFGDPEGSIDVHYRWEDLIWKMGTDDWPTRPSLRLYTNIWIYRGSSLHWKHIYLSGMNSDKYIYVYGTLIIDVDVYVRFFRYRFIHVMPGGRVIVRGGRIDTFGDLIYNAGGTVICEDGDARYSGEGHGIVNTESGTISISGGSFSGGVHNRGNGTISISGGFISHGSGVAVSNSGGGRIDITGGTICGFYPRGGQGGFDSPDIDNSNGTIWVTDGIIGDNGSGVIRTYGDLWIGGGTRVREIWMHRLARIHIISKLTVKIRFRFFVEGEFDIDVPIFIGAEGYKLTEEDLKMIDIELPTGYRLKLKDGDIYIKNKPSLHDLFDNPRPEDGGQSEEDPFNPDIPNGIDVDEDTTLPDLHTLFGSKDGSKPTGPMFIWDCVLRIPSASTTFSHIEVKGEGDAHIETQGKMIVDEGTKISGFKHFVYVKTGGSLIWQGGTTSNTDVVIDNDGGIVELKSGEINGTVKSNVSITANGGVFVENLVMENGTSVRVAGPLTCEWKIRIVDGDADVTKDNIKTDVPLMTSTEDYTLTPEDLEHVTVNLPDGFFLAYDNETKSIVIKKEGSEVGIEHVQGISADTPVNIYSVSGSLQKENATNIDGLSKGMYIINGRKIVVK